jgi:heme exporter protein B
VRRGSVLLSLLVLPLAMPLLIFGSRAVGMVMDGDSPSGPLQLLAAIFFLTLSLGPVAMSAAIRISVES